MTNCATSRRSARACIRGSGTPLRSRLLLVALLSPLVAGCGGGDSSAAAGGKPEDALSGFYLAVLGDAHYYDRACSFASPRFHVRATEGARKPPTDLCPAMAEYVHDEYEHKLTAADFWVEQVDVRGRTADAVTSLGPAALEQVGGEWRVLWVQAPQPAP